MAGIEIRVRVVRSPAGATATLAEIDGSIDSATIQQFQQVMDKLIEHGVQDLVLDCGRVKYINSTGLGTLLKYADIFESRNGHIAFCRVPSKVLLVMEMLGFNVLFNIVADEAAALRSFSGTAPVAAKPGAAPALAAQPPVPSPQSPPFTPALPVAAPPPPPPPAPALPFPAQVLCARCRVTLEIPAVGKFKCPRCGAILALDPTGRIRFFASRKGQPLELNLPCSPDLLPAIGQLAARCAEVVGFRGAVLESVSAAVREACANVIQLAYGGNPGAVFHLFIQPDSQTLTIKIADYGKPFDFGAAGSLHADARFGRVIAGMDTVEHRINPRGGNLLTLIKVLQ